MSTPSNPASTSQLTLVLDRFDAAWQGNQPPQLADVLTGLDSPAAWRELLLELIPIDLEYRWRKYGARQGSSQLSAVEDEIAGLPRTPSLRHYSERLPELGPLENLPLALFAQEYRVRRQFGGWHGPADFEAAYPTLFATVGPLLTEMDRNLTREPAAQAADPSRAPTFSIAQQSAALDTSANASGPAPSGSRTIGPGFQLGEYRLLERLGKGGMGEVFKAEHRRMQRIVALKVLPPERVASPEAIQRFHREVVAIARLDHPNVVTAHDAREDHGVHYLVMKYVPGVDLARLIKEQGPLPVSKAVAYMLQAARGLVYTHDHGVVHRDLKPANFLLANDGTIMILDLGLARLHIQSDVADSPEHGLTTDGDLMGTADFMAPEQALNAHKADARSDIYSLGATLYYLLTGQRMYAGDTFMERVLAHQTQPIPSLSAAMQKQSTGTDLAGAIESLDAIFHKLVAKAPAERYQSMAEVVTALESLRPANLPETALIRSSTKAITATRRSRWLEVVYGGVAVLALVTGLFVIYGSQWPKGSSKADSGSPVAAITSNSPKVNLPSPAPPDPGEWSEPVNLGPVVNSGANDNSPCISADGLTLLFDSDRAGSQKLDLWMTTRRNVNESWGAPTNLGDNVNSPEEDSHPELSTDGLTLLFGSERAGGRGKYDIWSCRRSSTNARWGAPAPLPGEVNSEGYDVGPSLSADGLTLLFQSDRGAGYGKHDLWQCTRDTPNEPFGAPVNLGPVVNTSTDDAEPALSVDGLKLFFLAKRGGKGDLWTCERHSRIDSFASPMNLGPNINSTSWNSGPSISTDGNTLYFYSDHRSGGQGGKDLWMSTRKSPTTSGAATVPYVWPKDAPAPAIAPFNETKAKEHQEAWAKHLGVKVEFENSIGMKFRLIPPRRVPDGQHAGRN